MTARPRGRCAAASILGAAAGAHIASRYDSGWPLLIAAGLGALIGLLLWIVLD